ncbi:TPR repeat-containing protein [Lachnospiraceae bacterium NE2001]|nr:TPR repeat-containing protein [Lachnospiraceae bacterium NE2001]
MAIDKRDEIEEKRIKRDINQRREREAQKKKKRNLKLAILCSIFSIIVILGAAFIILHCISDKEELRDNGIAAFNEGKYDEAINNFTASLEQDQWFSDNMDDDTRLYLAACYMRTDSYEEAVGVYEKLRERKLSNISDETLSDMIALANALNDTKNGNILDNNLNKLTDEYDRGNKSIALYLGSYYEQKQDYENMEKYYNDYIANFGVNTYIAYQLSAYYLRQGKLEDAISMVNKGLSAEDDLYKDKVLYNDIIISEKQLDYESALGKAEKLYKDYPNNETYKKEYDFLYSRVNIDTEPVHTEDDEN